MNDAELLAELEPEAARLLQRHLDTAEDWYPHEIVPWERAEQLADRGFVYGEEALPQGVRSALLVNLLTEDNLPWYTRTISRMFGGDSAWGAWAQRWTAEEARHSIVIRDYLMATRGVDPYELEDLRMAHMSLGYQTPYENDMLHTIAYVSFQELATRISHRNTGKISADPIAEALLQRVSLDENLHMLFYRNTLGAALDMEPNASMRAIADVVTNFDMPGANMPGFGRKAVQIALAGIYDMEQHLEEVIAPVLRAWNVFDRTDLSGDGLAARDELAAFLSKTTDESNRFNEKRELHFERLIARGQEPLRIIK